MKTPFPRKSGQCGFTQGPVRARLHHKRAKPDAKKKKGMR